MHEYKSKSGLCLHIWKRKGEPKHNGQYWTSEKASESERKREKGIKMKKFEKPVNVIKSLFFGVAFFFFYFFKTIERDEKEM